MPNRCDKISVRPACSGDVPQLCELLSLLFTQEADFDPDLRRQERGLRLILEHPEFGRIYCAIDGERIVGMASVLFTPGAEGLVAWLEDMIVQPDWRGEGVGERLLQAASRLARTTDCQRITLLTDEINIDAMRFYRRAGFAGMQGIPMRLSFKR